MAWQFVTTTRDVINALLGLERTMGAVSDALAGVRDQLGKARVEILTRIGDLENQLAAAGKLDEADQAAINDLKDAAQAIDDVVPDRTAEPAESEQPVDQPAEPVNEPEPAAEEPVVEPDERTEPTA
jgi:hypothetical protein